MPYRGAFPEEHRHSAQALQAHVEDLTKRDVKIAYLKNLQGYLWEEGYKTGAYATPLFDDVVPRLRLWKDEGVKLAIYSSGSVFAQKLLFQHVRTAGDAGEKNAVGTGQQPTGTEDLRSLMLEDGWFDTTNAGLKTEAASYQAITKTLQWSPEQTLFFTDSVLEHEAAVSAGLKAVLLIRPGNAPVSDRDRERLVVRYNLEQIKIVM